jgi:DNA (cytosine-5)-methyltransferase 1
MAKIKFGSVCSGIEAASVAWHPLGWEAAWLAEIEPFPSAVLAHHYPTVPNLGDMTLLPARILSGEVEAPDVFCGGTPCQAFSIAGLRNSLDDHRGNLSLIFCEIANAIDQRRLIQQSDPAIIFWENVPGVLNTKDNAFGCFLAGLAGEDSPFEIADGKWTSAGCVLGSKRAVAWRTLDAQYFGVAQRRRRVFVVASAREGFNPTEVLFEFTGERRDTPPSREAGESSTRDAIPSIANCLQTTCNDYSRADGFNMITQVYENHPADSRVQDMGEVCNTVTSRWGTGGGNVPFALQAIPLNTMTMQGRPSDEGRMGSGIGEPSDPCPTITKAHSHAVALQAYSIREDAKANTFSATPLEVSTCIGSLVPSVQSHHAQTFIAASMAVRRLTPTECERLQGFPDGYTNVPFRKKPASDGPRYKALGNSWAVPVVAWIGKRINDAIT